MQPYQPQPPSADGVVWVNVYMGICRYRKAANFDGYRFFKYLTEDILTDDDRLLLNTAMP